MCRWSRGAGWAIICNIELRYPSSSIKANLHNAFTKSSFPLNQILTLISGQIFEAMGRHFRPARVYQATTALLESERITRRPPWYDVVGGLAPPQSLTRLQPLPHSRRKMPKGTKKASKLFQPQEITYEEDLLRGEFFKDHPWEFARPRMIIENDGRDSYKSDWSKLQQPHTSLSGER